jgi:hypothetical protein
MNKEEHTCLVSAILPCPYVEIKDNHTGLGSVILPCTYVEIKDNHTGLGSVILMYKEEWLRPIRMIIPDFCIWTRKNG